MASKTLFTDRNKKIFLVALLGALGIVIIYEVFLSDSRPKPRPAASADSASKSSPAAQASPSPKTPKSIDAAAARQAAVEQILADTSPLDTSVLGASRGAAEVKRNIFAYYVAPQPPPPPPPPPPPIALRGLQPQVVVAGTPKPVTIVVLGMPLPPDAQVYFGGAPKPTKKVSENELSIEIGPAEYAAARQVSIEVKSQANPAVMNSNSIPFIIQPAPLPPFKYVGRIGEVGIFELIEGADKQYLRLKQGATIQSVWHIDAIAPAAVDVTDTRYSIKRKLPLEEKK
jgi:hypothetical protein